MADSTAAVAGTNAAATEFNNLRKDVVLGQAVMGTETYGASIAIDWSDLTKGKVRTITLAGNPTITFSNPAVGQAILIRLIQDATGSRTITWPTIKWPGGSAPTLTTTASKIDSFLIVCTAASTFDGYHAGFGLSS